MRLSAKISCKSAKKFLFYCTKKSTTPSFIDNFWKEKFFVAANSLGSSSNFNGVYSRVLCVCLQKFYENRSSSFCLITSYNKSITIISIPLSHFGDDATKYPLRTPWHRRHGKRELFPARLSTTSRPWFAIVIALSKSLAGHSSFVAELGPEKGVVP